MEGRKHQKPQRTTDPVQTLLIHKIINISKSYLWGRLPYNSVFLNSNYDGYQTLWNNYGPLKLWIIIKLGHTEMTQKLVQACMYILCTCNYATH